MGAEKNFENKIKDYIKNELKGWYVKFFANSFTKSGIPDILACINGYFVAIEVKAQNGIVKPLQERKIREIRKAYGFAFVVYPSGWKEFKKFLDDLNKGYYFETNKLPTIFK